MNVPPFEENIAHAKALLEKLMDPSLPLDQSLKLYEEGMEALKLAQKQIEEANLHLETIKKTS